MKSNLTRIEINRKKLLIWALLTATLFCVAAVSTASARSEVDPTLSPDADGDNPTLIASLDDTTTVTSGDTPTLYREQDNSTAASDENSTLISPQNAEGEEVPNLISGQPQPDYFIIIVGVAAFLAAITVVVAVLATQRHKKPPQ